MQNGAQLKGTANSVHKDPAIIGEHELSWDGLPPKVVQALSQPLDPALVSQRKGRAGRTYDYLEGHVVIDQANRTFGHGGWGYELVGEVTLRRIEVVDTKTGDVRGLPRLQRPSPGHGVRGPTPHRRGVPSL